MLCIDVGGNHMRNLKISVVILLLGIWGILFILGCNSSGGGGETSSDDEQSALSNNLSYPIVDTAQKKCYDNSSEIICPEPGYEFYGQDSQHMGNQPQYVDNGDGTITDLVTGLMWTKSIDWNNDGVINYDDKLSYAEGLNFVEEKNSENYLGYNDWRLPSIKELYSLIIFTGIDPSGYEGNDTSILVPFIDTMYFDFAYGDLNAGERIIDAQFLS